MSDPQFFQTRMGRQHFEVTMPELVRQIHRLNDLLTLAIGGEHTFKRTFTLIR